MRIKELRIKELSRETAKVTTGAGGKKRLYLLVNAFIFTIIIASLIIVYLRFEWNNYQARASADAIQLAQSLESLLHPEHIATLSGSSEDLEKTEYIMAKQSLMRLVETTNRIRFAFLMKEQNGKPVFLLDSESPESPDYSPPGEVYEEADDLLWEPYRSGEIVIVAPIADRWGTWTSTLVPIKDSVNDEIIAVFGIAYSTSEWYAALWQQMIPSFIVVIVFLMLYFSMLYIWDQHSRLNILNQKLVLDGAYYRSVFEQAPIGIAIVEDKTFATQTEFGDMSINPMYEKILGRHKEELQKVTWVEITHAEDLSADLEEFDRFKKGEISGYTMEKRFIKPDGSVVWTNMKISPLLGPDHEHSMHLCLLEDISERKQTELALKESERRETVFLSHLPGLAYRCKYDRVRTMLIVSDGCYNLTGYRPECFLDNRDLSFNDLIMPEYRDRLWSEWERTIPNRLPYKFEYEITTATGQRKWVLEIGQGIYNEQSEAEALEGIILDISDRKEIGWTGLYNREYFERLLENDAKKQDGLKRAAIIINLSTIQLLAANYGFNYTQNLIKKAAEVLSQYCTDQRMLFQTYENRFVFYVKDYKDKNELVEFSEALANTLESLFAVDRISGGIGVLELDQDYKVNSDVLLRRLLIASERSLNIFDKDFKTCFYDEELEAQVNREGEIRRELSRIAADDNGEELFLQYQPILDLKKDSISGFEALARLKTENLGLVPPVEFIPIAEQTKLIIPIGEKIIRSAFRFLNRLKENGYETINISINVSAIQLLRPNFTDRLFEMMTEMGINPNNIGFEITESVFAADYEYINNIIGELRDAGFNIAIDDFGTGYSSLAREKELKVTCLKIDKYFIDKLFSDDLDKAITSDIISLAHKLGHCAIAEGVECENQLQYLKEHGCDKIQGYLISKPLDEEEAFELLKNGYK